jgi:hypothetical protein
MAAFTDAERLSVSVSSKVVAAQGQLDELLGG